MGKLYVVGIGPGGAAGMTAQAAAALAEANVICGYDKYIALIGDGISGKRIIATGMTREAERCRAALDAAAGGDAVAVVSSGDAGVYGMAGLILELAADYPPLEVEVVPGVSAAMSGAAVLGAPLTHDFAVISLSDLLTPWGVIEKRLAAAAAADFVICLYNPASRGRPDNLAKAVDAVLPHRPPAAVCGWVRNAGRSGQEHGILALSELRSFRADMLCTVFIGSSATVERAGKMITPRGYPETRA